jgi:predicted dehydrogenase
LTRTRIAIIGLGMAVTPHARGLVDLAGKVEVVHAFPHDDHRAVMSDFVDAIREGREPKVTGEEALKVHRLIDALIETGRTGTAVSLS